MRRRMAFACVTGLLVSLSSVSPGVGAGSNEWYSYQYGPFHRSDLIGDTSITPANVASLSAA